MKRILSTIILSALPLLAMAEVQEARLLRFPSVGGDKIAFTYAGDLYTVSVNGGEATRLTSDIGFEMFSRISPDGKTIAFTAQYDGNTEVYSLPIEGGVPERLTYTATIARDQVGERMGPNNIVMCWTPDGKNIVLRSKWHTFSGLRGQLATVPAEGGELTPIPTSEGGFCSYSPDGKKLALNRMFREFRTWKYYRGGQADDIWINTVGTTELENITNNPAQDIFPMWIGNEIYFLSDRDHIMNLFKYDVNSRKISKVTDFDKYDCKFPSYSSKYIVFENGGYIYKYSVADGKCEKVTVYLNSEARYARNRQITYKSNPRSLGYGFSMSPDGSRVLSTFRGDLFSLPAENGAVYNLMPTQGTNETTPLWSPDGKKIAFLSDESGNYQIYVMPYNAPEKKECISSFKSGTPRSLTWSADSRKLYYTNSEKELCSMDAKTGAVKVIMKGKLGGIGSFRFSYDEKWIVYVSTCPEGQSVVYLYDVLKKKSTPVTSKWYNSGSPMFSSDGKYLYFTSGRKFSSRYSAVEWNSVYSIDSYAFVIPLQGDRYNPNLLTNDEYVPVSDDNLVEAEKVPETAMTVDLDGIIDRAVALPLPAGSYRFITAEGDDLYYSAQGRISKISMKDLKVTEVAKGIGIQSLTADKKKALVSQDGKYYVADFPSLKKGKALPLEDLSVMVDYHKEWKQIFNETWRNYRDNFYVKNMAGADWKKVHDKYEALLPYVNQREDLTYIIGEMIGELVTGHCYITTGEAPKVERVQMGLLGAKFSKDQKSGYFRINKIFKGENWGDALRSPLGEPGLGVKEGDFVVAINGQSVKDLKTIYEALIGKVGVTTALTINSSASDKGAKTIYVKPIADEAQLAYFDWVQNNIRKVEEATNGEIGYIHIPDMVTAGLDAFTKLFYTQLHKKALIIDDRMNGGGNVSPMILERLNREVYRLSMGRGTDKNSLKETLPDAAHYGPKVCLIDKYSSSDGDLFPYSFKQLKVGKLIGMRTWGGIVGIGGSSRYLDGQDVRVPVFTSYSVDGEWIVENHGVDPDIEMDINPFEDYLGNDAQLTKAIEVLQEELKNWKPLPSVPENPVRARR